MYNTSYLLCFDMLSYHHLSEKHPESEDDKDGDSSNHVVVVIPNIPH